MVRSLLAKFATDHARIRREKDFSVSMLLAITGEGLMLSVI